MTEKTWWMPSTLEEFLSLFVYVDQIWHQPKPEDFQRSHQPIFRVYKGAPRGFMEIPLAECIETGRWTAGHAQHWATRYVYKVFSYRAIGTLDEWGPKLIRGMMNEVIIPALYTVGADVTGQRHREDCELPLIIERWPPELRQDGPSEGGWSFEREGYWELPAPARCDFNWRMCIPGVEVKMGRDAESEPHWLTEPFKQEYRCG